MAFDCTISLSRRVKPKAADAGIDQMTAGNRENLEFARKQFR